MIKKSQAHKMSTQITLNVPTGFVAPALLAANNAADNALILNAGCMVLGESRDQSAGLSMADMKARLTAEAERTIAEAKAEDQKTIDALKADIERQIRVAASAAADFEKQVATARSESEAASTKAAAAAAAIASARSEGKADADKAAEHQMAMLKAAADEAKQAASAATQAATVAQQRLLEAEKASASKAAADLKAAAIKTAADLKAALDEKDKAAAAERAMAAKHLAAALALKDTEAAKERERLAADLRASQATFHAILTRQAGSSTKGADNEHALAQVVKTAFAASSTYKEHIEKKLESGDIRFEVEGVKVMLEGKNYAHKVPQKEVLKAYRDMAANPEYDVLMFVSEHSDITGHVKPGSTDICIVEGKPAAFIGNFAQQQDKVAHVQMVLSTLMAFCRLQQSVSVADADAMEAKQHKIEDMLRLFRESSADMDGLLKSMKFARRQMDVAWDTFAGEIRDKVATFKRRLTEVQSEGVAASEGASSPAAGGGAPVIAASTKARKPREPMTEDAKAAMAAKRAATVAAKKADKWANFSSQQGDTVRSSPRLQSGGR